MRHARLLLALVSLVPWDPVLAQSDDATAETDFVRIQSIEPLPVVAGRNHAVTVEVEYHLPSADLAVVQLTFNTGRKGKLILPVAKAEVTRGRGTCTLRGTVMLFPSDDPIANHAHVQLHVPRKGPPQILAKDLLPVSLTETLPDTIDQVAILDVTHGSLVAGQPARIVVRISYNLHSTDGSRIYLGFNGDVPHAHRLFADAPVSKGRGELTLEAEVTPHFGEEEEGFAAFVNLSADPHPPAWTPLASAEKSIAVSAP